MNLKLHTIYLYALTYLGLIGLAWLASVHGDVWIFLSGFCFAAGVRGLTVVKWPK